MIRSPWPVVDAAPVRLSAYSPAPMNGESPTRPGGLNGIPPVDVPAARLPARSRAIAPTVSCPNIVSTQFGIGVRPAFLPERSLVVGDEVVRIARLDPGTLGELVAHRRPVNTANGLSRTRRASVIACGTPRTDATEPTSQGCAVHHPGVELDEALLAERRATPGAEDARSLELADRRSTASRALPPSSSTCQPARAAARQPSRWRSWSGGAMSNAPPWTAIAAALARRRHAPSISPIGPVGLEAVAGHREDDGPGRAPTVDRARPACAAADVGSTKTPCAEERRAARRGSRHR